MLVTITQVVLPELPGRVAVRLKGRGNGRVLRLEAEVAAGHSHLGQAGSDRVLPGDERGSPRGAALLAVVVGEADTFVGDSVDVRGAIAHQPVAVAAQIRDADVITPDHQDVRLALRHRVAPLSEVGPHIVGAFGRVGDGT